MRFLKPTFCIALLLGVLSIHAQHNLMQTFNVNVLKNSDTLNLAWHGGLNVAQFSEIDLNFDGKKDVFIYDREKFRFFTYLNDGIPNTISYTYTNAYDTAFPFLNYASAILMRDINCDGKNDLIVSSSGRAVVYENTSTQVNGIQFTLVSAGLESKYLSGISLLYISPADFPSIDDIDGDGDLDILTFDQFGPTAIYHKNLSMELLGRCSFDTVFEVKNYCWGFFSEGTAGDTIILNHQCMPNVSNPENESNEGKENNKAIHSGATLLTIDLDNDSVKDLLLGDVGLNNIISINNGGGPSSSNMVAFDINFPSNTSPINVSNFPALFYLDVNNDSINDLIANPFLNSANIAYTDNTHLYLNSGANGNPIFNKSQNSFLQGEMIDHGRFSSPVAFDYNGDGLKDLVVSNFGKSTANNDHISSFALYKNTSVNGITSFEWVSDEFSRVSKDSIAPDMHPAFGDMDNDGDEDMIVGTAYGSLYYYENTGGVGNDAEFNTLPFQITDTTGNPIFIGQNAKPFIVDLNRDGLFDMIVGERSGNINYYENIGNVAAMLWHKVTDTLGGIFLRDPVTFAGNAAPIIFEVDSVYHLMVGESNGVVYYYNNIDNNLLGSFNLLDSNLTNKSVLSRSTPCMADFNNDSLYEFVTGSYLGGLTFYETNIKESKQDRPIGINNMTLESNTILVFPNPAKNALYLNNPQLNGKTYRIYNAMGQWVLQGVLTESKISLNTLSVGFYSLIIENEQQLHQAKFIIR